MNCRTLQRRMADGPWTIEDDPEAQAHLDDCPDCRRVLDQELRVRAALQRLVTPEVDEALMQRLRSIPYLTEAEMQAWSAELASRRPALSRRRRLRLAGEDAWDWLRGLGSRGGGWDRDPADEGFAAIAVAHRVGAKQRGRPDGRIRASGAELLLLGAVAAVAVFLLWPHGRALLLGQGTATPIATPVGPTPQDAGSATPSAGPIQFGAPTLAPEYDPFPLPERVAMLEIALRDMPPPQLSEQDSAAYAAADARAAAVDPVWRDAPPVVIDGPGLELRDYCVQPERGVALLILQDPTGIPQSSAGRLDQRVLQIRLADLALGVAVQPRLFADLSDLPGASVAQLEAIDCARTGGRVLIRRSNEGAPSTEPLDWTADLWLLDAQGRRLHEGPLGMTADQVLQDAELAPDGRAALVMDDMGAVAVLRLGDLPGGAPELVDSGSGTSSPSGAGGGVLRWSDDGRAFLMAGYEVEGPTIEVYRWDGQAAGFGYRGRGFHAFAAATPVPPQTPAPHHAGEPLPQLRGRMDAAGLGFTADGKLTWLQWRGGDDDALPPLANGEERLEVVVWDWAAADQGRGGFAGFSWQSSLPNTFRRAQSVEQALGRGRFGRDPSRGEREWLLLDRQGYLYLVTEGSARLLARAEGAKDAMDLAPMPAVEGAELLVFKKEAAAGEDVAAKTYEVADWLGTVVLPGGE
ncbi:MAG: hypothetical protein ACH37Z_13560 [Anaerolineae bacterium]